MDISLKLSAKAQKVLEARIKKQVGAVVEKMVFNLHDQLLKKTPAQTGRTLASWKVTVNASSNYDAGDHNSFMRAVYDSQSFEATNHLPVGAGEPNRGWAEDIARSGRDGLRIKEDPYRKFVVSNAAKLGPTIAASPLDTTVPGSRAFYMNVGAVPGYDIFHDIEGVFTPRGERLFESALDAFKANPRAIK